MLTLRGKYNEATVMSDNPDETTISQIYSFLNNPAFEGMRIVIMEDCHKGEGAVIGFTATMNGKIVPNIVGVDINCFSGDTKVKLTDGRDLSFLELIDEYNEGKDNFCFSKDKKGRVVIGKIENPSQIGVTTKLLEVTLDNGEKIRCTEDHIFYTRDNAEIKAGDLKKGQSLYPLYIDVAENVPFERLSYSDRFEYLKKYLVVYNPHSEYYDLIHFLADNYNLDHEIYTKSKGRVRHHKDFYKFNNNPTNIDRMTRDDHWKLHSESVVETNKLGITGFKRARELHPELFSKVSSDNMKKLHENPEFAERLKQRGTKHLLTYQQTDKAKEDWKENGKRGAKYLSEYNKSDAAKEKLKGNKHGVGNLLNYNRTLTPHECPKCGRVIMKKGALTNHLKACRNHVVTDVKVVECIDEKVYCLTVPEWGNFALSSGVFVSNCAVEAYLLEGITSVDFPRFDHYVRRTIPSGKGNVRDSIHKLVKEDDDLMRDVHEVVNKIDLKGQYVDKSLGSLGGGNHFLEIDVDELGRYWLVIHSGSRNFGAKVATYHQQKAKEHMRYVHGTAYAYKTQEYLEGTGAESYLHDMAIAQKYAELNRKVMVSVLNSFFTIDIMNVECVKSSHNYINMSEKMIRKGAISAHEGERVVIPLNMRDGIIIARGKGNADRNFSAPHGAGRALSRTQAKKDLNMEEFQEDMKGIWSSCITPGTLDEAPRAYKDFQVILDTVKDTVDIEFHMKPVYVFKATEQRKRSRAVG